MARNPKTYRDFREAVDAICGRDPGLAEELREKRGQPVEEEPAARALAPGEAPQEPQLRRETIVLKTGRPVLEVSNDEAKLVFQDAESQVWRERLVAARTQLVRAIRASGRIELQNHSFDWVGTGWLLRPDIIVTNRHVAALFARQSGDRFVFRFGLDGRPVTADIDFLEEFDRDQERTRTFRLRRVLHIEPDRGPDIAFLEVAPEGDKALAEHLSLAGALPEVHRQVAVVGYPARDSRIPDLALMEDIFGDVFDKKRLAPGQISGHGSTTVQHDCSTLGGNSGSVVLDLASGEAVGLHFAGRFLEANFAVPAPTVADRLDRALRGRGRGSAGRSTPPQPRQEPGGGSRSRYTVTRTVPIQITVQIGEDGGPQPAKPAPVAPPVVTQPTTPIPSGPEEDDEVFEVEARPEDYLDREGYKADFLGEGIEVPLPQVVRDCGQVVSFELDGANETELKYQHFSVAMNRERRLCFYSGVNIDGAQLKSKKRRGWRIDPRIPRELQIRFECYGNFPKFSRGHMTRRKDPMWGSDAMVNLGNSDSMHVTNAVPQMQPFNGGIWLGLEDYALDNSRDDDMKICVLTGPIFSEDDPIRFGVRIPVEFWKVIAFIHDETDELSATGYSMSQAAFLTEEEFVFGEHETFQRSLAWIEDRAGVSFGALTELDLFEPIEEAAAAPLMDFSQIRFF